MLMSAIPTEKIIPRLYHLSVYIPFVSWLTTSHNFSTFLHIEVPSLPSLARSHQAVYPKPCRGSWNMKRMTTLFSWSRTPTCEEPTGPRGIRLRWECLRICRRSCYRGSTTMHHHFLDLVCTDSMLAGPPAGRLLNLRDGDSNPNFDQ